MTWNPLIIGVSGMSGAGKTHFLNVLKLKFGPKITTISLDNYYKDWSLINEDSKGYLNFDEPSAIDSSLFCEHLLKLIKGESIHQRVYSFENRNTNSVNAKIIPADIIVAEGLFLFQYPEIDVLFNHRVFIHTGIELCYERRLYRDLTERGIPEEKCKYQWENHVLPSFEKYIQPHSYRCDLQLDGKASPEVWVKEFSKLPLPVR